MESLSVILALAGLISAVFLLRLFNSNHGLDTIPAIGLSGPLSYYRTAFQFTVDAQPLIREGCKKFQDGIFKVATPERWRVVVSGPTMIEELHRRSDDELSFDDAAFEMVQMRWTMGMSIHDNPYHLPIIRSQLTRSLGAVFSEIHNEIITAWEDSLPLKGDEWLKVPALSTAQQIVTRASNRVFVGLPLCRDPDYVALNIKFTVDVMKTAGVLNLLPSFLRPIVGPLLTSVPTSIKRGLRHLKPIIEARQKLIDEYGKDYPEKPNDFLAWIMDQAKGEDRDPRELTLRVLFANFVAIHTSAMAFTHALYYLAVMPHYVQPLRDEIEAVVREQGWTKLALGSMHKVDSFIKESMRMNALGSLTMARIVRKGFTFSNGIHLPTGAFVSIPSDPTHYAEEHYINPDVFDGFRFSSLRESDSESVKHQLVNTSPEYLAFSHGKHACPGRFFASTELKLMLAHMVISYDVKLEDDGVRPANMWFAGSCLPNPSAHVLFRRRQ